jgi:hypothetical protein
LLKRLDEKYGDPAKIAYVVIESIKEVKVTKEGEHKRFINFDKFPSFPPWTGIFFKPARCGYPLSVTSQTLYSPEYTTPTQHVMIIRLH